jgi:hypothetical protein
MERVYIFSNTKLLLYFMTIIASYPNHKLAQSTYDKLLETGLERKHISIATLQPETSHENKNLDNDSNFTSEVAGGTTSGAVAGAAIGLLIGAVALTIPGFGALLISGPLALAFGSGLVAETTLGATIGGIGGFVSGLIKAGATHEDAKLIETNLQGGEVIIAVKDDIAGSHKRLLESTNPTSLIVLSD